MAIYPVESSGRYEIAHNCMCALCHLLCDIFNFTKEEDVNVNFVFIFLKNDN